MRTAPRGISERLGASSFIVLASSSSSLELLFLLFLVLFVFFRNALHQLRARHEALSLLYLLRLRLLHMANAPPLEPRFLLLPILIPQIHRLRQQRLQDLRPAFLQRSQILLPLTFLAHPYCYMLVILAGLVLRGRERRSNAHRARLGKSWNINRGSCDGSGEQRAPDLHFDGETEDGVASQTLQLDEQLIVEPDLHERKQTRDLIGSVFSRVEVRFSLGDAGLNEHGVADRFQSHRDLGGRENELDVRREGRANGGNVAFAATRADGELHIAEERVILGWIDVQLPHYFISSSLYRFARTARPLVRLRSLSTRHAPSRELHFQLHRGSSGAQNADIVVNTAGFAVSQHQIGANSQRIGAPLRREALPTNCHVSPYRRACCGAFRGT